MKLDKSAEWLKRAERVMPGGVNSPVRAFRSVGGTPPFIRRASGAYLWDEDGNKYIDYVGSWGPMILGHAHPKVLEAIERAASNGTSFGAPTAAEVLLAEKIVDFFPSIEKVRLVNSGTEATMSAIRLARAATKRDKIVKFSGCYHGHGDSFLISAGSGATTFGTPDSPGVTEKTASDTLLAQFNDLESVEKLFRENPGQIAAVILEPIPGNMGVIVPDEQFLRGLREITQREGALLIFDEVMSGFRVQSGAAQKHFQIQPDLTTLGKVIGGGLPVGAYGGRADLMSLIAPEGPVYQAGTLSGNPLAVAAGLATLELLLQPGTFEELEKKAAMLEAGLRENLRSLGLNLWLVRMGTMLCLFFREGPVRDYEAAKKSDTSKFSQYFWAMLEEGIYLPPSQFEAFFISLAHSESDIEKTIKANRKALEKLFSNL